MQVVLANHGFSGPGGSEIYLLTVAEHLQRLGHDCVVFARLLGPMSEQAASRGVTVIADMSALPERCDVVLSQDAPVAYALAERYPEARKVFRTCSDVYDFELPPGIAGVVDHLLVVSDRYERLVRAMPQGLPVTRLRVPVDLDLFTVGRRIREQPQVALVFGNYPERRDDVRAAWEPLGVEVRSAGGLTDRQAVASELQDADIVVGKSRCVLEAMAAGRAAYVLDAFGGDGWVTPASYPALEADNFAGQATERVIDAGELRADLARYAQSMGAANRDLAMQHHSARDHVIELLALFERIRPTGPEPAGVPLRELARVMSIHATLEFDVRMAASRAASTAAQLAAAEAAVAASASELARVTADAERRSALATQELRAAAERLAASEAERAELERRLGEERHAAGVEREGLRAHAAETVARVRESEQAARSELDDVRAALAAQQVEVARLTAITIAREATIASMRATRAWRAAAVFWRAKRLVRRPPR